MIAIAVVFLLIGYTEWIYLTRDRQSPRTIRIIAALGLFLFLCAEAAYFTRNRNMPIGMLINNIFSPVEHWLFA